MSTASFWYVYFIIGKFILYMEVWSKRNCTKTLPCNPYFVYFVISALIYFGGKTRSFLFIKLF